MTHARKVAALALLVPILVLTASSQPALAGTIVDTGLNSSGTTSGGYLLTGGSTYQFLAGEFSIAQSYVVTDIEGWMQASGGGTDFTVAIYADDAAAKPLYSLPAGETPGTELYSGAATGSSTLGWHGASGLSWSLGPGTYWVSFEVRSGDDFDGNMPSWQPVPNPLQNYAFNYFLNPGWLEADYLKFGVRINATPGGTTLIPLPPAAFMGLGLLAILGCARRLRRRR